MSGVVAPAADPLAALRGAGGTGPTSKDGLGALDGNAFLTLLVEQMRAQDPTDPQSATDYLAQLATFAQVEQSVGIREAVDRAGVASSLEAAGALIGRTVSAPDGTSGTVAAVRLDANGATATLKDGTSVALGAGVTVA